MNIYKTEEHPDVATIINSMAAIYNSLGQIDKALEMTLKGLSKRDL